MHLRSHLVSLFLIASTASARSTTTSSKSPGRNAIKLSNVKSLTLHADRQTSHNRVPAIPQLECVGPSSRICSLYTPDVIRCTNAGSGDGGDEDIAWTCEAELPVEFKLGATDVVCEGYRDSEDDWVLKGSCGVRYRMLLTEEGEKKFGKGGGSGRKEPESFTEYIGKILFFAIFIGVAVFIVAGAMGCLPRHGAGGQGGGGGGGFGGGGPGPFDEPPPSYDDATGKAYGAPGRSYGTSGRNAWTPGFWSGAAGAAAGAGAGYAAGRWGAGGRQNRSYFDNGGEGRSGSSSSSSPSSSFERRHESTGFGSTSRR